MTWADAETVRALWPQLDQEQLEWRVFLAISNRNVGRRAVSGPWQALGSSRYSVPTVMYLSHEDPREVVVKLHNGKVEAEGQRARAGNHEVDPVGG